MNKRMLIIGAAALSAAAYSAHGAVSYTYVAQPSGGGSVQLGQSNTLNLYLQETLTSNSASPIGASGGLYAGAVAIVESAGGTGVTETGQTVNSAAAPAGFDPGGNNSSGALTNGATGAWVIGITSNNDTSGDTPFSSSVAGTTTTNLYLLGTVTLNVASNANATFKVESLHDAPTGKGIGGAAEKAGSPGTGNTLDFNGDDLDFNSASNPAFTGANGNGSSLVIASPEPTSLGLLALGGLGLLARRRRTI